MTTDRSEIPGPVGAYVRLDGDCWIDDRYIAPGSHAQIRWNGRNYYSRPLAWMLYHGQDVPKGKRLVPQCGSRGCVRPHHCEPSPDYQRYESEVVTNRHALHALVQSLEGRGLRMQTDVVRPRTGYYTVTPNRWKASTWRVRWCPYRVYGWQSRGPRR